MPKSPWQLVSVVVASVQFDFRFGQVFPELDWVDLVLVSILPLEACGESSPALGCLVHLASFRAGPARNDIRPDIHIGGSRGVMIKEGH